MEYSSYPYLQAARASGADYGAALHYVDGLEAAGRESGRGMLVLADFDKWRQALRVLPDHARARVLGLTHVQQATVEHAVKAEHSRRMTIPDYDPRRMEVRHISDEERRRRLLDYLKSMHPPHVIELVKQMGATIYPSGPGLYEIVGVADEDFIYLLERSRRVGEQQIYYTDEEARDAKQPINVKLIRQRVLDGG